MPKRSCKVLPLSEKVNMTHDPAIPLLGIHLKKLKTFICKDTRTRRFTAALSTVVKTWKQLKYPSTDDWTKKTWGICTMEYYSVIRKDEIAICNNMHGSWEYHAISEISQVEKVKNIWFQASVGHKAESSKWTRRTETHRHRLSMVVTRAKGC